jgi:hypothetical protein
MKRIFIMLVLALFTLNFLNAQEYHTGIGIRAGNFSGLTIKHFNRQRGAFEGLITSRWEGFAVTGLYELHNKAFDVNHLNWYYGGGAHVGFYNGSHAYWGDAGTAYTIIGIDGILGIEYSFDDIPINIGIDWKPALNLVGYTGIWSEGALSVRYIF